VRALLALLVLTGCTLTARRELVIEWGRRGEGDAGICPPAPLDASQEVGDEWGTGDTWIR
jgi:hypothetical protein